MQALQTIRRLRPALSIVFLLGSFLLTACLPEIPSGNPYDPDTPVEQQQKARIGGMISGASLDELGPLLGAEISITGPTLPDNSPLTTTDSGKYSFLGLEPGRYDISISHGSHITRDISYDLQPGEERLLDISLQPIQDGVVTETTGHLSGSAHKSGELVLDSELQDHSGITVEVEDTGIRTVTNQSGQFDLFLNAGSYNLILTAPNYNLTRRDSVEIIANGEMALDAPIVLDPNPGTLNGTLTLEGADSDANDNIVVSIENTSLTTLTDEAGEFQLTDIPAGTYTLRATKENYDTLIAPGVSIDGGRNTDLNARTLTRSRGALEGQIQLAAESIHSNISIEIHTTAYSAVTNAAGYFRLEGIPTGTYDVIACKRGYEPTTTLVNVAADEDAALSSPGEALTLARQQISLSSDSLLAATTSHSFGISVPSSVTEFKITGDVDDSFPQDFQTYNGNGTLAVTLSSGDGAKLLAVQFRGDGCYLSDEFAILVQLDTSGPTLISTEFTEGDISVSTEASLAVGVFDAAEIRLSGDLLTVAGEAAQVGQWIAASQLVSLELDGTTDGLKTIRVEARDLVGNLSTPTSLDARILLDRTAPANGTVTLDGGKSITSVGEVDLTIGADEADYMQISNDPAFTDATWVAFTTHIPSWPVASPETDGVKTIYIQFKDKAGNTSSPLSASITLDTVGTVTGFAQLEDSDECSTIGTTLNGTSQSVSWNGCQFALTDIAIGVYSLTLSQSGFNSESVLVDVDPTIDSSVGTVSLSRARGTAIGNVQLQSQSNHAGTLITFQSLSGDSTPDYTTTTLEDGSFTREGMWAGTYEVSAEKSSFTLKSLGQIIITGNETTNVTSAGTVTLSQQTGDFLVNGGAGYTQSQYVELSLSFTDIQSFRFRVNGSAFSDWVSWSDLDADGTMIYGTSNEVDLDATNETKTIEIQTLDTNAIESAEPYYQATIVLDTQQPESPTIVLDNDASYTNSSTGQVIATLSADDDNGIDLVVLTSTLPCDPSTGTQAYSPITALTLPSPDTDAEKTIYACFIDPAGNISDPATASITLDRSSPQVLSFGVVEEASTCTSGCLVNAPQLQLELTEDFDPTVVTADTREVWLARNDPTFSTGTWQVYAPDEQRSSGVIYYDLPSVDGTYTIYLQAKDAAENLTGTTESDRVSVDVTLDTTAPPTPAATLTEFISSTTASVSFSNTTDVASIEASWDPDFSEIIVESPNATVAFTLPPRPDGTTSEGAYSLYLRYVDSAGNQSPTKTLATIYDATLPSILAAQVNYGEMYLASATSVPVEVTCFDTIANTNELVLLINDSTGSELYNDAYSPLVTVDIPTDEGGGTLAIRCQDPASNITAPQIVQYVLDTNAPSSASLRINPAAGESSTHTNSGTVALSLSATDNGSGLYSMAIADTALDCATASYELFKSSLSWILPVGDGSKTVAACLRDRAGNETAVSESIVLDQTPPEGALTFPDGVISQSLSFDVQATRDDSDAFGMAIGPGILDCSIQSYSVFSGDRQTLDVNQSGNFSVSLCLKDKAGNTTRYTETAVVDLHDPVGYFTLNSGSSYSNDQEVTVAITGASADVTDMRLKNGTSIDCSSGTFVAFESNVTHTLNTNDGTKTVQVCLKDASGRVTALESQAIILDREGPTMEAIDENHTGIRLAKGYLITNETNLSVNIDATDATTAVYQFKISTNSTCLGGAWELWPNGEEALETTVSVEAADNESRQASVIFRDRAGNESACVSDSIVVDTIALTMTGFSADGGSLNSNFTNDDSISFSDTAYSGNGTCQMIQISETPGFTDALTTNYDCTTTSDTYTLIRYDAAGTMDGNKSLFARVIDTAGNVSTSLTAIITLDTQAPILSAIQILPGEGSQGSVDKYTNQTQVTVMLQANSGGAEIRYDTVNGSSATCPAASELIGISDLVPSLMVSFASTGAKTVCMAVIDEAGNESSVVSDTITIDQTAPSQPGLQNDQIIGANTSCADLTPASEPSAVDANFWMWEVRENGGNWTSADADGIAIPATQAPIKFNLHQDNDNYLEIRAVDKAGNRGESSQAYVEELSSHFIPTHLQIKQLCNGGEYAILKQMNVEHTIYENDVSSSGGAVHFEAIPEHALLNLRTLEIRSLSKAIDRSAIIDGSCNGEVWDATIIDAACSNKEGESALLLLSPNVSYCWYDLGGNSGMAGDTSLWVYPDPFGTPLGMGATLPNPTDSSGNELAINSIDALDWTGSLDGSLSGWEFRALATTTERYTSSTNTYFRHRIRRIAYDRSESTTAVLGDSTLDTTYFSTTPNYHSLRGLNLWNSFGNSWLRHYNPTSSTWQIRHKCTDASNCDSTSVQTLDSIPATVTLDTNGEQASPYGNRVSPGSYYHWTSSDMDPRKNFIYTDSSGSAHAYRYDSLAGQASYVLGTGAGTDGHPAIFDRAAGRVGWVDTENPRTIYRSDTYGNVPQQYRHAVDTSRPIISYPLGAVAGEPFVMFHTNALSEGIVLGYRDETSCVE